MASRQSFDRAWWSAQVKQGRSPAWLHGYLSEAVVLAPRRVDSALETWVYRSMALMDMGSDDEKMEHLQGRTAARVDLESPVQARKNYLQVIGLGIGAARAVPGAVKEYREAYAPAGDSIRKVGSSLRKGHLREAAKTYAKGSAKVGTDVLKAHGRVTGRVFMLTEEGQEAKQVYDEVAEMERESRPGKKKKKKKGKMKENPSKDELRKTYRTIRESYYCYESPRHPAQNFDAVIKVRAQAVPGGPSGLDPWAWIALAKELHEDQKTKWSKDRTAVTCSACGGSGLWPPPSARRMTQARRGSCFRCDGKGRQTASDMRRNCYYDIKGIPPGNLY